MRRINMVYTIPEEEYDKEIARLINTSKDYLGTFSNMVKSAASLAESGNHEGCIKALAQIRDSLAETDYRLHDTMNSIVGVLQHKESQAGAPQPTATDPEKTLEPAINQEIANTASETTKQFNDIEARLEEARKNISSLGLEIPEEQLQKLMRGNNDKTS
tara:strand:+ start:35 stop:514 length:480 start_codon:yes stop_codon:yes gene_type:complete